MLFLDCVVHGERVAELVDHGEEGADGHACGTLVGFAGFVERVPGMSEMVVKVLHVLGHVVVCAKLRRSEFGKSFFLGLRNGDILWCGIGGHGCGVCQ